MKKASCLALILLASSTSALAADTGALIGGAAGAAAGAAIGNNTGGKNGAILGAALGAAAGVMLGSSNQAQSQIAPVQAQPVRPVADDEEDVRREHGDHGRHLGQRVRED